MIGIRLFILVTVACTLANACTTKTSEPTTTSKLTTISKPTTTSKLTTISKLTTASKLTSTPYPLTGNIFQLVKLFHSCLITFNQMKLSTSKFSGKSIWLFLLIFFHFRPILKDYFKKSIIENMHIHTTRKWASLFFRAQLF
jgi:hypothetical protein